MGDGDAQSPSCWVPGGSHPAHKAGNNAPPARLWAHGGLCPEPGPTPHTGEMTVALRNSSEDLGMPHSRKTHPRTCCWASSAVPSVRTKLLQVLRGRNTPEVLS